MNRGQRSHEYKTFAFSLLPLLCLVRLSLSSNPDRFDEPYRAECSRTSNFDQPQKDHVLSNHVFASYSVTSPFECAVHCVSDTRCKSYNYQYAGTDCQLNDATKTGLGTSLTIQAGYAYYEHNTNTKVGVCRPNPCGPGSCSENCAGGIICDCRKTVFKGLKCEVFDENRFLDESAILQNKPNFKNNITSWLKIKSKFKLCFKGGTNGWSSETFHTRCDQRGPTISIVRVGQYIFGGYTGRSWSSNDGYTKDKNAFLFSLRNKDGVAPFKMNTLDNNAIYNIWGYHVVFGSGHDLLIQNHPNSNAKNSYSNLGRSYELPGDYVHQAENTKALMAGSDKFIVNELEVFYTSEESLRENSEILKQQPSHVNQLFQWLHSTTKVKTRWRLCWRATRDGWSTSTFHAGCDKKGPTVTVAQVGNYKFGGYTDKPWTEISTWVTSSTSFIFSLVNSENLPPFQSTVKPSETGYAIWTGRQYPPLFGHGYDFYIADNANENQDSNVDLGVSYDYPATVSNRKTILAGSEYFTPTAVEVFYQASDDLLYYSAIMSQEPQDLFETLLGFLDGNTGWTVCWRATRDGWSASAFHTGCDLKGTTLTIIKAGSFILGGYSVTDWGTSRGDHTNDNTFIFSLRNNEDTAPFKSSPTLNSKHVYVDSTYGPTFGSGNDIKIYNGQTGYSTFGITYTAPVAISSPKTFLAGSYPFTPTEVEVFYSMNQ